MIKPTRLGLQRALTFLALCGLSSGCATTLPMVRADYELLRAEVHKAKSLGAMECAPSHLAEAQVGYRFATMELGQGDFERASQHVVPGRVAVQQALDLSEECSAEGVLSKDFTISKNSL